MTPPVLCIFARLPRLGQVKRRLAESIGAAAALQAHETLVRDTLARLDRVPGIVSELWLDGPPNEAVSAWLRRHPLRLRGQQGDDLGDRMLNAMRAALERGAPALLVGTDCPLVDSAYVQQAAAHLHQHDIVLGPAEDGGYALIGARPAVLPSLPDLFAGVAWGTNTVLADTVTRVHGAGLSLALLQTVWDVDDADGWQRFLAQSR